MDFRREVEDALDSGRGQGFASERVGVHDDGRSTSSRKGPGKWISSGRNSIDAKGGALGMLERGFAEK